jgi:hypothetical protein
MESDNCISDVEEIFVPSITTTWFFPHAEPLSPPGLSLLTLVHGEWFTMTLTMQEVVDSNPGFIMDFKQKNPGSHHLSDGISHGPL